MRMGSGECSTMRNFVVSCLGLVVRMEEGRSAFKIFTGKPTRKRPFRRPRWRWEDNILNGF